MLVERTNAFVLWCVLLGKEGGKWPQPLGSGPGREAGGFLSRSLAPDENQLNSTQLAPDVGRMGLQLVV